MKNYKISFRELDVENQKTFLQSFINFGRFLATVIYFYNGSVLKTVKIY